MPIPDFSSMMLPLFECLKEDKPHDLKSLNESLAWHFELTDEELSTLQGEQTIISERINEAMGHLQKAGLLETQESFIKITSLGKLVLNKRLNSIDVEYLRRFPEVRE
ncbi:MAG: winged helix-turn-helix domain-containing protein [Cyclobacteriaceae bacterium]